MSGNFLLINICNFHVSSHLLLIYIYKIHWNLNTMFVCQVIMFWLTYVISMSQVIYYWFTCINSTGIDEGTVETVSCRIDARLTVNSVANPDYGKSKCFPEVTLLMSGVIQVLTRLTKKIIIIIKKKSFYFFNPKLKQLNPTSVTIQPKTFHNSKSTFFREILFWKGVNCSALTYVTGGVRTFNDTLLGFLYDVFAEVSQFYPNLHPGTVIT